MENEKEKSEEYIELAPQRGHTRVYISTRKMVTNNFLGGIAWGVGTVLGAAIIAGVLIFTLSKLDTVPYLGSLINDILSQIQSSNPTQ